MFTSGVRLPGIQPSTLVSLQQILYISFLVTFLLSPNIKAAALPTEMTEASNESYHGNPNDYIEAAHPGFFREASTETLKGHSEGHVDERANGGHMITTVRRQETQVITQQPLEDGVPQLNVKPTFESMDDGNASLSDTNRTSHHVEGKFKYQNVTMGNRSSDDPQVPSGRKETIVNGLVKNGTKKMDGLQPFLLPGFQDSGMHEKSSDLWSVKDKEAKSQFNNQSKIQDQIKNTDNFNNRSTDGNVTSDKALKDMLGDGQRPQIPFEDIPYLNTTSDEETTTERVLKWNIQNSTNYSSVPEIDESKYPVGKVCILLNGTVVKDMEEGDCKFNSGLHYKYIPARLMNNGTGLNYTVEPVVYTAAPGEDLEDGGISPEAMDGGDAPNWEDAQWALYNAEREQDQQSTNSSQEVRNSSYFYSPPDHRVEELNPLDGQLLNISHTNGNPFEAGLNSSGKLEVSSEVFRERGFGKDQGWGKEGPGNADSDQVPDGLVDSGAVNRKPTGSMNMTNEHSVQQIVGHNFTVSGAKNYTQMSSGAKKGSLKPNLSDVGFNKGLSAVDEDEGVRESTGNIDKVPKGDDPHVQQKQQQDQVAIQEDKEHNDYSKGQTLEENIKFVDLKPVESGTMAPADKKDAPPKSVHLYHGRPLHAIQGLIWEDRRYMMSVLVPVACGMVGAFLIVCLAYLSRYCPSRQSLLKAKQPPPQPLILDRVMLLADSSDEEEF